MSNLTHLLIEVVSQKNLNINQFQLHKFMKTIFLHKHKQIKQELKHLKLLSNTAHSKTFHLLQLINI